MFDPVALVNAANKDTGRPSAPGTTARNHQNTSIYTRLDRAAGQFSNDERISSLLDPPQTRARSLFGAVDRRPDSATIHAQKQAFTYRITHPS